MKMNLNNDRADRFFQFVAVRGPIVAMAILLLIMFFSSCSPARKIEKQRTKAARFYNEHPTELRDKSVIMFPDRITAEIKGESFVVKDSTREDRSTPGTVYKERTIERLRVDTITKRDGRDADRIRELQANKDSLQSDKEKLYERLMSETERRATAEVKAVKAESKLYIFILSSVAVAVALVALKFKRII